MSDCGICCETYNRSNHKKVTCPFCDFGACRLCIQTYLTSTINDPHCMGCKKAWNREFVDQSCTKVFRNTTLKKHRENILFEREKCLFPQTQVLVQRKKQRIETARLLQECKEELFRQRRYQHELEHQLYRLDRGFDVEQGRASTKTNFVRKCPMDNCKGFLSDKWKCGICDTKICSKCNEPNEENHECDPNNVETVKLLAKDTKPCPTCGTMIFKISGCSQMWCPDCHTAFCWRTGNIETGVIHNPHFYEFQMRTGHRGRNHGDIPCGGMPQINELVAYFHPNSNSYRWNPPSAESQMTHPKEKFIFDLHRIINHVEYYEIRGYTWREPENSDLRVQYLMNELDDQTMKTKLQEREKCREKYRDIYNVLRMFCDTSADFYRQLVVKEITPDQLSDYLVELSHYVNESMTTIHNRYNCVTPFIQLENPTRIYSNTYKKTTPL